jgi:hypothetical protein
MMTYPQTISGVVGEVGADYLLAQIQNNGRTFIQGEVPDDGRIVRARDLPFLRHDFCCRLECAPGRAPDTGQRRHRTVAVAGALNARRIRTARGGRWYVATVQNLLARGGRSGRRSGRITIFQPSSAAKGWRW